LLVGVLSEMWMALKLLRAPPPPEPT